MQVEYVAGVRLTSRGALQQETQRTVGYRVLGKVVVNYQDVLAVVHEELAHCAAGVGCDVLKRCGVAGGCVYDYRVIHRAVLAEVLGELRHGGRLLTDSNVNADYSLALLVEDSVQCDGGLAGLAVADYQLTLTSAYREHGVYRQQTGSPSGG